MMLRFSRAQAILPRTPVCLGFPLGETMHFLHKCNVRAVLSDDWSLWLSWLKRVVLVRRRFAHRGSLLCLVFLFFHFLDSVIFLSSLVFFT